MQQVSGGEPVSCEDWVAAFEERAAILEFDGGHSRTEAECLARAEIVAALGPRPEASGQEVSGQLAPKPSPPIRNLVPFESWRRDRRRNKHIVTIFNISSIGRCVSAHVGPLVQLTDGPRLPGIDEARHITADLLDGKHALGSGGRWPLWIAVVEGDHRRASFPTDPDSFDAWFPVWVRDHGITVIGDWRDEARADGALEWLKNRGGAS